jgi:hypothetical protein
VKSKKPISPQRLAANRANSAHSTGPRTLEGKCRSALNSRKHQFFPENYAVVRLEEGKALVKLRDDLIALYRPINSQEIFAVERIAVAQQCMSRVDALESGVFTCNINEAVDPEGRPVFLLHPDLTRDITVTVAQNRNYLLGEGFTRQAMRSNVTSLVLRYRASAERMYRWALEEFNRLKSIRSELPDEPIYEPEPEETKSASAPPTNPPEPPKPLFVPLQRPIPPDPTIAITSPNPPRPVRRDAGS